MITATASRLAALLSCLLLAIVVLAGTAKADNAVLERPCAPPATGDELPIQRRMLLGCGGGGGGGGGGSPPASPPPTGSLNECRVTFSRRGFSAFSQVSVERFNIIGQRLATVTETNPSGTLNEGESLTVALPFLTDVDLRQSYFLLRTDGNSERCDRAPKTMSILLTGETATNFASYSSTCETTFWHTRSFWRCQTKATFRFRLSLECKDNGTWSPRHFTSGETRRPTECDGCFNCF